MSEYGIPFGGAGDIPPVPEVVPADKWDNAIRAYGVVEACLWFGHTFDSDFTLETIRILREISEQAKPLVTVIAARETK